MVLIVLALYVEQRDDAGLRLGRGIGGGLVAIPITRIIVVALVATAARIADIVIAARIACIPCVPAFACVAVIVWAAGFARMTAFVRRAERLGRAERVQDFAVFVLQLHAEHFDREDGSDAHQRQE